MAIEINRERKVDAPFWITVLIAGMGVVLLFLVAVYVYFVIAQGNAAKKIAELEASVSGLNKEIAQKEEELSFVSGRINDFSRLIASHKNLTNVFNFLEENTIGEIWYSGFDFSGADGGAIILEGFGPDFIAVGQQVDILKGKDSIKEIYLKEISIDDEGEISFALKLIFKPEIFSFEE
ncbi:MAG: hypothetical protein Q8N69_02690 [bacterium]|nr:hypothetical protein [bacterium]